jgi:hypothetical protein
MLSYLVFIIAPVLVYFKSLRFLLMPMLFYIVYGALGNAVTHTWWCVYLGKYFPGFYTGSLYWIFSPILLGMLLQSKRKTGIFISAVAIVLLTTTTILMK